MLGTTPFHVAWSKSMVEVHDPMYSSVATGYREIGPLRDYLNPSRVALAGADHNETSRMTFGHHNLRLDTPIFVLYFFPELPQGPTLVSQPPIAAPAAIINARSRSRTPASGTPQLSQFLPSLLRITRALDERYIEEADLLNSLRKDKYGSAYTQIRQTLVIEDIFPRAKRGLPGLTIDDVAAWAGIKPKTYLNHRTFAVSARATLQYLCARARSSQMAEQSSDNRQKEKHLKDFLGTCFSKELATGDWDTSNTSIGDLTISGSAASAVKERLLPFEHFARAYKRQSFATC
ncbi:hypothetical protein B0H10DRAFT_2195741 [Mycena sp. CBHHK59/15]|nr:hypothetical protein B0H10DRAFT_2195741 [Mycena sp. CBHHK59/15]